MDYGLAGIRDTALNPTDSDSALHFSHVSIKAEDWDGLFHFWCHDGTSVETCVFCVSFLDLIVDRCKSQIIE